MFQYFFEDGTVYATRKGLAPLAVEDEEKKHGELMKVKEVKDALDRDGKD